MSDSNNNSKNSYKEFPNLATHEFDGKTDKDVAKELKTAGIPVMYLPSYMNTEVKTRYIGVLNGFIFIRAWRYWQCNGNMPLEIAEELHKTSEGMGIRAGGHADDLSPETMCVQIDGSKFVDCYHIDTPEGLAALASCIKSNKVHTENTRILS